MKNKYNRHNDYDNDDGCGDGEKKVEIKSTSHAQAKTRSFIDQILDFFSLFYLSILSWARLNKLI